MVYDPLIAQTQLVDKVRDLFFNSGNPYSRPNNNKAGYGTFRQRIANYFLVCSQQFQNLPTQNRIPLYVDDQGVVTHPIDQSAGITERLKLDHLMVLALIEMELITQAGGLDQLKLKYPPLVLIGSRSKDGDEDGTLDIFGDVGRFIQSYDSFCYSVGADPKDIIRDVTETLRRTAGNSGQTPSRVDTIETRVAYQLGLDHNSGLLLHELGTKCLIRLEFEVCFPVAAYNFYNKQLFSNPF